MADGFRADRRALASGGKLVVTKGYLGLFDTPPDRQEIRFALAVVGVLYAALLALLPLSEIPLGTVDAFVPMIDAIMFALELIIGALLFAQAAVFRSRALTVLGSGYVFIALLLVPHVLTFPGAFSEHGLLGAGISTTAWLALIRRLALPTAVILYALLKRADAAAQAEAERPPAPIFRGVLCAVALAAVGALWTTIGQDFLPPVFVTGRDALQSNLAIANSSGIVLTVAAMVLLFRQTKSVLDLWLLVAMASALALSLLNFPLHTRFTLGWYGMFGLLITANFVVMFALIAESSRLYARLALSVAARDRERETRLMSMDAIAAAIAHEVGQPLTAVTLSAMAGVGWLNREPPNSEMAMKSLHDTIDAGRRTFDVVKSIREAFAPGSRPSSDFSLNDLVRETASLLDRELAAQEIFLQLELDESLPPIHANRAQIQRVIVNLLTNAIDSLAATRHQKRCISIRSAPSDGLGVLLDVSDSGLGMAPERMSLMFEPFFTTKSNGTGLGLSLSRTIVEDHGGRLWASTSGGQGATFHVHLPSGPMSEQ
jgi:signal transduction histidine kinase